MIVFNVVIVLIGVFLILPAVRQFRQKNSEGMPATLNIMSKESTTVVRGAAILFIALHHFSQYYEQLGPLQVALVQCGYAMTAVFFFLSGYGCYFSLRKYAALHGAEKVKKTAVWFISHSVRLYLDFIIVYVLDVAMLFLLHLAKGMTPLSILKGAVTVTLPTWVSWYPKIQILCYLLLSVTFLLSDKRKNWLTLGAVLAYMGVAVMLKLPSMWYSSVLCFPLGCLMAEYLPKRQWSKRTLMLALGLSVAVFGALFVLQYKWHPNIWRTVSVIWIPVMVAALTGLFPLESGWLARVGTMSFEIYLIHSAVLRILISFPLSANVSLLLLLGVSVLLGWLLHLCVTRMMALFPFSKPKVTAQG